MSKNGGSADAADTNDSAGGNVGNGNAGDNIAEQIRLLQAGMDEISRKLGSMYVLQRINDDILRKSANSINVIVRLLAGCCHLDSQILWDTLIGSGALLNNVKPSVDQCYDQIPISHSKLHQLKFVLIDLINVLQLSEDDTANSTHNNGNANDRRPSTSSSMMNTYVPENRSTSEISSDAESTQFASSNNDTVPKEEIHAEGALANSEIQNGSATLSGSYFSVTTDRRTSAHDINTAAANQQHIENVSHSITLSDPHVIGDIKWVDRIDSSIASDEISSYNDKDTNEQQEIKCGEAKTKIKNASGPEILSDYPLTSDKPDNPPVDSVYSSLTPIHLATIHSSVRERPVESKEASALRRKYNNKYRYMENYKNTNRIKSPLQNDINKDTSNMSRRFVKETKTAETVVCYSEPRVVFNEYNMYDSSHDVQKTKSYVESIQSEDSDKTSGKYQVIKQNKRIADDGEECYDNAVTTPRAPRSIIKADKNNKPMKKKKKFLNILSNVQ